MPSSDYPPAWAALYQRRRHAKQKYTLAAARLAQGVCPVSGMYAEEFVALARLKAEYLDFEFLRVSPNATQANIAEAGIALLTAFEGARAARPQTPEFFREFSRLSADCIEATAAVVRGYQTIITD